MQHDVINDALAAIKNAEDVGKPEVVVRPTSKLLIGVLDIMKKYEYVGDIEDKKDSQGGSTKIRLLHKINKCGVIKPRFPVKKEEYEKWEKRFLPARNFGLLIVSTPQGLMSHQEAKSKGTGGRLIAYVY